MLNPKYDTNELISEAETLTEIERDLCLPGGLGVGVDWELGISRCKLLHREYICIYIIERIFYRVWVNNKATELYSISCNKPYGKEYIYIHIYV